MCNAQRRGIALLLGLLAGCQQQAPPSNSTADEPPDVPHGYLARLLISRDGQLYRFGPFVGYYFRPTSRDNFEEVDFVCFNEEKFYASDMPAGARLFTGRGVLTQLEHIEGAVPESGGRIRPVFFDEAPPQWLGSRPEPQDEYLHFHSAYNAAGAVRWGYWLRHRAVDSFTYDMGGRVEPSSPLYHRVEPGWDRDFARIIEFDFGPADTRH